MAVRDIVQAAAGSGASENYFLNLEKTASITDAAYYWKAVMDSDKNTYLAGQSSPLANGQSQGTITKVDAEGARVWSKYYRNAANSPIRSGPPDGLTLGPDGYLYFIQRNDSVSPNRATLTKADTDGNIVWRYDLSGNLYNTRIKFDASGYMYLLAELYGSPYSSTFLMKLTTDRVIQWQYQYTSTRGVLLGLSDLIFDDSGNMYLGGYQNTANASDNYGPSVMKLTSTGAVSWTRFIVPGFGPGGRNGFINGNITRDPSGNIYFLSDWRNPDVSNNADVVYCKLNSSGAVQWVNRIRPTSTDTQGEFGYGTAGYYDTDNNLFFIFLRARPTESIYANAINCIAIDSSGVQQWNRQIYGYITGRSSSGFSFQLGRNNSVVDNSILMAGYASSSTTSTLGMGQPAFYGRIPLDDSIESQTLVSGAAYGVTGTFRYITDTFVVASQTYADGTSTYPVSRSATSYAFTLNSYAGDAAYTPAFFSTMELV